MDRSIPGACCWRDLLRGGKQRQTASPSCTPNRDTRFSDRSHRGEKGNRDRHDSLHPCQVEPPADDFDGPAVPVEPPIAVYANPSASSIAIGETRPASPKELPQF